MKVKYFTCLLCLLWTLGGCTNSADTRKTADRWWTEQERQFILSELDRTTLALQTEIHRLTLNQWNFKEGEKRWNIAEIVEHLEMQNQLHFREISVIVNSPQHLEYRAITEGNDYYFTKYATDSIKGQANWFLQPKGKFKSKEATAAAFYLAREKLYEFVKETKVDLRKQFTYRAPMYELTVDEVTIGQVRDLHQLLLTGIAHTDRHLKQIRTIKSHPNFPNSD